MIDDNDIDKLISDLDAEDEEAFYNKVISRLCSCHLCREPFKNRKQLRQHIHDRHGAEIEAWAVIAPSNNVNNRTNPVFRCRYCRGEFADIKKIIKHVSEAHCSISKDYLDYELKERIKDKINLVMTKRGKVRFKRKKPRLVIRPLLNQGSKPVFNLKRPMSSTYTSFGLRDRFSTTIRDTDLNTGVIRLPSNLKVRLRSIDTIGVVADTGEEEKFDYNAEKGEIEGLEEWFRLNAIAPGDKIYIKLLRLEPPSLKIWTEWERHLSYLFRCPPEDFKWKHFPLRDCLILAFRTLGRAASYRELYAIVSKHRDLNMDSLSGALSQYNGVLFDNVGSGMWALRADIGRGYKPQGKAVEEEPETGQENAAKLEIVVAKIKENDLVYELLKKLKEPLSYNEICQRFGKIFRIEWKALAETGFIVLTDSKIRRLDNGDFTLEEWFDKVPRDGVQELEKSPSESSYPPVSKVRRNLLNRLKDSLTRFIKAYRSFIAKHKKG